MNLKQLPEGLKRGQRRRLLRSTAGADQPHRDDGQTIGRHLFGHCLGGGIELCLGSLSSRSREGANIGLPEMDLGSTPAWAAAPASPRRSAAAMLDMILRAKTLTGSEALAIGLVNEVWPLAELKSG